jgi:hypothetical protein
MHKKRSPICGRSLNDLRESFAKVRRAGPFRPEPLSRRSQRFRYCCKLLNSHPAFPYRIDYIPGRVGNVIAQHARRPTDTTRNETMNPKRFVLQSFRVTIEGLQRQR